MPLGPSSHTSSFFVLSKRSHGRRFPRSWEITYWLWIYLVIGRSSCTLALREEMRHCHHSNINLIPGRTCHDSDAGKTAWNEVLVACTKIGLMHHVMHAISESLQVLSKAERVSFFCLTAGEDRLESHQLA